MKAVRTMHGTVSLNKALLAGDPLERDRSVTQTFGVQPGGTCDDQKAMERVRTREILMR